MAQNYKIKHRINLSLFVAVFFFVLPFLTKIVAIQVIAGNNSVATSVTVGNSAPTFSVAPAETVASYDTSPSNVGTTVTITATGSDANSESYYLAVCKTNAITPVNGSAPTCPGTAYCIGTLTSSGAQGTCSYTTLQGDPETNNWYAFVCDNNATNSTCSASSQGSGNPGSPFIVNHPPIFSAIGVTTPVNVGATVSWTTGIGTSDTDSVGGADTVKLLICKTTGIAAGACDGGASDTWCSSNAVANNPSCSIGISVPTPDMLYNAYAYIVDSHNFTPTGGNQGSTQNYTVNNAVPSVSAVTLNGGAAISVTEGIGITTPIAISAIVTDNNGCNDLTTVTASTYRSGINYGGCDTGGEANANQCYPVISCSTSNCQAGNAAATYSCTVSFKSHADPTTSDSKYPLDNWLNTFVATDNNSAVGSTEVSAGVELNTLVALDVTNTIAYGNLSAGQSNSTLDKVTIVTATGNTGLDEDLKGTNMLKIGETNVFIAVTNQKYSLAASTVYASGTSLQLTDNTAILAVAKTTSDTGSTKPTYWGLLVPAGTVAGEYAGTNTVTAKIGATNAW